MLVCAGVDEQSAARFLAAKIDLTAGGGGTPRGRCNRRGDHRANSVSDALKITVGDIHQTARERDHIVAEKAPKRRMQRRSESRIEQRHEIAKYISRQKELDAVDSSALMRELLRHGPQVGHLCRYLDGSASGGCGVRAPYAATDHPMIYGIEIAVASAAQHVRGRCQGSTHRQSPPTSTAGSLRKTLRPWCLWDQLKHRRIPVPPAFQLIPRMQVTCEKKSPDAFAASVAIPAQYLRATVGVTFS